MELLPVYMLSLRTAFMIFIIFSFGGWCSEVLYVGIFFEHKFVNRGFLHGPLCPIYGCGGLAILCLPQMLYTTWIPLFFASMIMGSLVEYFGSWLLEKLFHTKWWDYSHYKFNIKGRVCLLNSTLFGVMGLLTIHFIYPLVMRLLDWFGGIWSGLALRLTSDGIAIALVIDMVITVKRLVDFNATMAKIKAFGESLKDHYGHEEWFRGESLTEMLASVKERAALKKDEINQSVLDKIEHIHSRQKNVESFMKRFPTMKSTHYKEEIILLRAKMKERLENRVNRIKEIKNK